MGPWQLLPCPRGCCSARSLRGTEARGCDRCQSAQGPVGTQSPAAPPVCLTLGLGLRQLQWLPSLWGSFQESRWRPARSPLCRLSCSLRAEPGWRLHGWALPPACTEPWGSLRKGADPLQQGALETRQGGANFPFKCRSAPSLTTTPWRRGGRGEHRSGSDPQALASKAESRLINWAGSC